ncbi:MAG: ATP-binding protein [Candidatus Moranbacteria bacterium]|nr:ATP-binding protein [Candidatus Moranbacteria bacterium]
MNKEIIKSLILSQREIFLNTKGSIERSILSNPDFWKINALKEAVIITGVRRSGKSYLLRLVWQKIVAEKSRSEKNFLYFNFEDEKLLDFSPLDFDLLLEAFFELFETKKSGKIYLFFDEIQNISGWEKFINRLIEEGRYKIYITGSNARLLSREIGTALTGRNYPVTLFPLSFFEFASHKLKRKITKNDFYGRERRIKLKKAFSEYLENGGFPEVVLSGFRPLLQEYLKNIIYRDIFLRYRIKSEINLREIVSFVSSNIGVPLSFGNIARMAEMKNVMTVKNYLSYLLDSFLFFPLSRYSHSIKQQIYNPDKMYLVDSGLYFEVANLNSSNFGRALENAVFLELKRRKKEAFYFSGKKECDFLVVQKRKVIEAVQVTRSLGKSNEERELAGLFEAMEKYGLKKGLIITEDQEGERKIGGKAVKIIPAWKWILEAE